MIARTPEKFRESGVNVLINREALGVDYAKRTVQIAGQEDVPFDFLVLATGARAIAPSFPGTDLPGVFTLKSLDDAIRIKFYIKQKKCGRALIIGAGFIAMEMCEALQQGGIKTTVIHHGLLPAERWDPELSRYMLKELQQNSVEFITRADVSAIEQGKNAPLCVRTNQGEYEADLVLLATGVRPETKLAQAMGLTIGKSGAISVNFSQRTSKEDVYAVGDCCESYHRISRKWTFIPLGDIANKQGRIVGRNIGGKPLTFNGVVGAQSFRLFNLEVAATGIDEREALAVGYNPISNLTWGNAIVRVMGERNIGLKLVADKSSGVLLGAQAVGEMGAVSRINSLSVALWSGMNIDEIAYLDFAYSPPYSGAWDIIHVAAQSLRRAM